MSKEYTFPPKLKLIVDHLDAVRTLDMYVNGVELKKDMQGLSNHLQQDLNRSVFRPAGWEDLYSEEGSLFSSPQSAAADNALISKWCVAADSFIAIEICPAWPVGDDDEPYVNLYVPPDWEKRPEFIAQLKAPPGFQHVSQYSEGELAEESSVWKYVPYASYVGAEGLFDSTGFINGFREATKSLVAMEKVIDGILEGLA
jgi:hypothetical protein